MSINLQIVFQLGGVHSKIILKKGIVEICLICAAPVLVVFSMFQQQKSHQFPNHVNHFRWTWGENWRTEVPNVRSNMQKSSKIAFTQQYAFFSFNKQFQGSVLDLGNFFWNQDPLLTLDQQSVTHNHRLTHVTNKSKNNQTTNSNGQFFIWSWAHLKFAAFMCTSSQAILSNFSNFRLLKVVFPNKLVWSSRFHSGGDPTRRQWFHGSNNGYNNEQGIDHEKRGTKNTNIWLKTGTKITFMYVCQGRVSALTARQAPKLKWLKVAKIPRNRHKWPKSYFTITRPKNGRWRPKPR